MDSGGVVFRVPSDPNAPTFDHTFKVGFFRWLTSKPGERKEWARRRNMAAGVAQRNQQDAINRRLGRQPGQ